MSVLSWYSTEILLGALFILGFGYLIWRAGQEKRYVA